MPSDWPLSLQFNPELVLVSAGFDAARGDPLGGYHVTPEGYAHLTHLLMSLAAGRVLLILEVSWSHGADFKIPGFSAVCKLKPLPLP